MVIFSKLKNKCENKEEMEAWTLLDFVKEYRKLNENRLAYLNIGYLKPEKFKEYKQKV